MKEELITLVVTREQAEKIKTTLSFSRVGDGKAHQLRSEWHIGHTRTCIYLEKLIHQELSKCPACTGKGKWEEEVYTGRGGAYGIEKHTCTRCGGTGKYASFIPNK